MAGFGRPLTALTTILVLVPTAASSADVQSPDEDEAVYLQHQRLQTKQNLCSSVAQRFPACEAPRQCFRVYDWDMCGEKAIVPDKVVLQCADICASYTDFLCMGYGHNADGCHLYKDNADCGVNDGLQWYTCEKFKVRLGVAGGTCAPSAPIITNEADCREAATIHGATFGNANPVPKDNGVNIGCWTFTGSGVFDFNTATSTNFYDPLLLDVQDVDASEFGGWNFNVQPVCKTEAAADMTTGDCKDDFIPFAPPSSNVHMVAQVAQDTYVETEAILIASGSAWLGGPIMNLASFFFPSTSDSDNSEQLDLAMGEVQEYVVNQVELSQLRTLYKTIMGYGITVKAVGNAFTLWEDATSGLLTCPSGAADSVCNVYQDNYKDQINALIRTLSNDYPQFACNTPWNQNGENGYGIFFGQYVTIYITVLSQFITSFPGPKSLQYQSELVTLATKASQVAHTTVQNYVTLRLSYLGNITWHNESNQFESSARARACMIPSYSLIDKYPQYSNGVQRETCTWTRDVWLGQTYGNGCGECVPIYDDGFFAATQCRNTHLQAVMRPLLANWQMWLLSPASSWAKSAELVCTTYPTGNEESCNKFHGVMNQLDVATTKAEYTCAFESEICTCNGDVKYGYGGDDSRSPSWTPWKSVSGKVPCTNTEWGDSAPLEHKLCICRLAEAPAKDPMYWYTAEYLTQSKIQCTGNYGDAVGDANCCGQAGTISQASHICGKLLPICISYQSQFTIWAHMGNCVSNEMRNKAVCLSPSKSGGQ